MPFLIMNNENRNIPKTRIRSGKDKDLNWERNDAIQGCCIHDAGETIIPRKGTRSPIVKSSSNELRNINTIEMIYVLFCFLLRR